MNIKSKLLWTWILIGILCRISFMPFTLHPDILHIYYHPFFLASKGIWDIYSYHANFFKEHHYYYYTPLTYIFFGTYLYLIHPLLPGLDKFMEDIRGVTDQGGGHSGHYLKEISTPKIFRFLFLMKFPYLFFDIGLLGIMISLNSRQELVKWWALNPMIIYTCYLLGQFDIIPTFAITLGVYFAVRQKNILAMALLGIGTVLKSFPIFLILPFSIYLGRDLKGIIRNIVIGILPLIIILCPFFLSSGINVIGAFISERIASRLGVTGSLSIIRPLVFMVGYSIFCFCLLKESVREKFGKLWPVKLSLLTLALLFIIFPISFHYFLWITPFILILGAGLRARIMNMYILSIFCLIFSTLAGKGMWMGLFAPIYPAFFIGLPSVDEIVKRVLPYTLIKDIASFMFAGIMLWISVVLLREGKECPD